MREIRSSGLERGTTFDSSFLPLSSPAAESRSPQQNVSCAPWDTATDKVGVVVICGPGLVFRRLVWSAMSPGLESP